MVRRFAFLAVALAVLAPPAWAGFETGWYAYTAGDYETARLEWLPLAEDILIYSCAHIHNGTLDCKE